MISETVIIRDSDENIIFTIPVKNLIDSYLYEISKNERLEQQFVKLQEKYLNEKYRLI